MNDTITGYRSWMVLEGEYVCVCVDKASGIGMNVLFAVELSPFRSISGNFNQRLETRNERAVVGIKRLAESRTVECI